MHLAFYILQSEGEIEQTEYSEEANSNSAMLRSVIGLEGELVQSSQCVCGFIRRTMSACPGAGALGTISVGTAGAKCCYP